MDIRGHFSQLSNDLNIPDNDCNNYDEYDIQVKLENTVLLAYEYRTLTWAISTN